MIEPEGLLTHARSLVPQGRGRPPDTDLRRGVSAAYYALFHAITDMAASHLLRSGESSERAGLRRTWGHGEIDAACELITTRARVLGANPNAPMTPDQQRWGPLVDLAATDPNVVEAARLFGELQEQRHAADYDHLATFDKATLLSALQDAQDARDHLRNATAIGREALTALLIVRRPDLRARS